MQALSLTRTAAARMHTMRPMVPMAWARGNNGIPCRGTRLLSRSYVRSAPANRFAGLLGDDGREKARKEQEERDSEEGRERAERKRRQALQRMMANKLVSNAVVEAMMPEHLGASSLESKKVAVAAAGEPLLLDAEQLFAQLQFVERVPGRPQGEGDGEQERGGEGGGAGAGERRVQVQAEREELDVEGAYVMKLCTAIYMQENFPTMCDVHRVTQQFLGEQAVRRALNSIGMPHVLHLGGVPMSDLRREQREELFSAAMRVLVAHAYHHGGLSHAYRLCQVLYFPKFETGAAHRTQGLQWALEVLARRMPTKDMPPKDRYWLVNEAKRVVRAELGRGVEVSVEAVPLKEAAVLEVYTEERKKQILKDLAIEPIKRAGVIIDGLLVEDGIGLTPLQATGAAARNFLANYSSFHGSCSNPVATMVEVKRKESEEREKR